MTRCEWVDEKWVEDLVWCPSQCYRRIKCNGKTYTLYLRWRWENPWVFTVIEEGADGERIVAGDLFSEHGLFFRDTEYREAEKKAEELFLKWIKSHKPS